MERESMKTIGERIDEELAEVKKTVCREYCKYYQVMYWRDMTDKEFEELLDKHCGECPMGKFGF